MIVSQITMWFPRRQHLHPRRLGSNVPPSSPKVEAETASFPYHLVDKDGKAPDCSAGFWGPWRSAVPGVEQPSHGLASVQQALSARGVITAAQIWSSFMNRFHTRTAAKGVTAKIAHRSLHQEIQSLNKVR